jgi:WD40 repeat protein
VSWQDGNNINLLWIKGGAGKGKTMMSIGLIEQLSCSQDERTVVIYFFCQNSDSELNTIDAIIKGLIYRLISQQKDLQECLRRHWNTATAQFDEDITAWQTLWVIFLEMLELCKCQRIFVVVDALDECRDEQDMAELFKRIVRTGLGYRSKVKWLLTSRPLDSAERALLAGSDQVLVSLELNATHIAEAVKTYAAARATELDRLEGYGLVLRQKVEAILVDKSEDTFLWVSLVCQRLEMEKVHRDKVLATIQELPPGLHHFYKRVLKELSQGDSAEGCLRLLKVMLLAYRPLKQEEVAAVTGLPENQIGGLVDRCASFIKKRETDVDFVHQSARDYLGGEDGRLILDSHELYEHGDIALSCLFYLSEHLKVNITDSLRPATTRESMKALIDENKNKNARLTSIDYAATFWVQHLKVAKHTTLMQNALAEQGKVERFLRNKLLEWLECLSLLDELPRAVEAFKVLRDEAEVALQTSISINFYLTKRLQGRPYIFMYMKDATRFLLRHYQTIATWPLQTYSSAIVLSPQASAVRRGNLDKVPRWLKNLPQVEEGWASLIQTLEGHSNWVTAVAFSPSGKQIASGSQDWTIRLWDATTGGLQKTLKDHSFGVRAVAFSPDGKQIVSASGDWTIRLWDTTTGGLQKTLKDHSGRVSAVAFSPDGKQIASGSDDKTIRLWDATTGGLQKILEGHSGWVMAVAFSPDGKQIVSGSEDWTIRLWDTTTGGLQKTLEDNFGRVTTVAFSPDGKRIASGSDDKIVRLWDATTGGLQKILEGHSGGVTAVAFSPDGKQIASTSSDWTIRLWDVKTGGLQKTLEDHSNWVMAVAFSPDGKQIASGSEDWTIRLWDATIGGLQKTLKGRSKWISAVAFSPDGKQIASGSQDKTVKLWDATTSGLQKTLESHSDWVTSVVFSPDGKQITSGSDDKTVRLWDATTGGLQKTLKGHSGAVTVVAFSPNGKQIASGSHDSTIKLWDATIGGLQKILKGHSDVVTIVAFSPSGNQIASGSRDSTIKLWDTTTGGLQKTLKGHSDWVKALAFSPDGKQIASGSHDKTIKLWDVAESLKSPRLLGSTLSSLVKFRAFKKIKTSGEINSLKFSEDGHGLVTNLGPIKIESVLASVPEPESEDLWVGNRWIYYGAIPIFPLTLDFEPQSYSGKGNQVAIGLRNGRVLSFEIDRRNLHLALKGSV